MLTGGRCGCTGGMRSVRRQDLRLANDVAQAPLATQQQGRSGAGLQPAAVVERVTQTVLAKMLEVIFGLPLPCATPVLPLH